ncbi:hypothetical protein [Mesorhizobium sp.]|uniref:hypothetical protein n=1 Tax=Mesorhizobium sp. TaxID=1871066 RepID=UPI0025BA55F4|nr:hypothetical protein [Mesorhizobium sp.]
MFDLIDFKAVLIIALIFTPLEQLLPLEALLTADIGFYLAHRAFRAVPFLWRFQPSTTRSRRWTGWLRAACTRWTRS